MITLAACFTLRLWVRCQLDSFGDFHFLEPAKAGAAPPARLLGSAPEPREMDKSKIGKLWAMMNRRDSQCKESLSNVDSAYI